MSLRSTFSRASRTSPPSDDYQTWVDEEGEEIGTLHRSQFLYEVAEALRIFAALAPWERTPAMEELFTLAPVLLHDHDWR